MSAGAYEERWRYRHILNSTNARTYGFIMHISLLYIFPYPWIHISIPMHLSCNMYSTEVWCSRPLYSILSWRAIVPHTFMEGNCTPNLHSGPLYSIPSWRAIVLHTFMVGHCTHTFMEGHCTPYLHGGPLYPYLHGGPLYSIPSWWAIVLHTFMVGHCTHTFMVGHCTPYLHGGPCTLAVFGKSQPHTILYNITDDIYTNMLLHIGTPTPAHRHTHRHIGTPTPAHRHTHRHIGTPTPHIGTHHMCVLCCKLLFGVL